MGNLLLTSLFIEVIRPGAICFRLTVSSVRQATSKNYEDFKATVLEVKKIEGMGATIDIIIVNGILKIDDKIILSGFDGCITTTVKALMTPHPMKELRVKNDYLYHKEVRGSMGVKL